MRNYVNQRDSRHSRVPSHIWIGVSVENTQALVRLTHLNQTRARVRFVSFEPLLERIAPVDLHGVNWAIVGGESGPGARVIEAGWVRQLWDTCIDQGVAFFFKQWGGRTPKARGNKIDGRQWLEMPYVAIVQ